MRRKSRNQIWLALTVVAGLYIAFWFISDRRDKRFDEEIRVAARRYSVDPALVKAVIWKESRFNPSAEGRVGEAGLMQIRPAALNEWTAAEKLPPLARETLFNPATNTLAGSWYLGKLLKRYRQTDDPIPYALADYNAGRSHVLEWLSGEAMTNSQAFTERIGFPATRAYVAAITRRRERYRGQFEVK